MMKFKFQLGEFVTTTESIDHLNSGILEAELAMKPSPIRGPYRMTVLERRLTEFDGGAERTYHCRHQSKDQVPITAWFVEIELVPYPYDRVVELWMKVFAREAARREK